MLYIVQHTCTLQLHIVQCRPTYFTYTVCNIIIQVCIPGLHLSLGIFNRLYTLLENACHALDLLQAERSGVENLAGTSFGRYSVALTSLTEKKRLLEVTQHVCRDNEQLMAHLALRLADAETSPQLKFCREWLVQQTQTAETLVYTHPHRVHAYRMYFFYRKRI